MEQERKELFSEAGHVLIRFEKAEGRASFRRSIAASDAESAVKALGEIVCHFSELVGVPAGDVLARIATDLFASDPQ